MNAPAYFSTTFGSTAERTQRATEPYLDAVPIGWLVNARMRQLRQLCRAQADGSAPHNSI